MSSIRSVGAVYGQCAPTVSPYSYILLMHLQTGEQHQLQLQPEPEPGLRAPASLSAEIVTIVSAAAAAGCC